MIRVVGSPQLRRLTVEGLLRRVASPSLADFLAGGFELFHTAETLALRLLDTQDLEDMHDLGEEADEIQRILRERTLPTRLPPRYPERWGIEVNTMRALYILVRTLRPAKILETGVANGHSTFVILAAMRRNGVGTLTSVDIHPDVGAVLSPAERQGWDLRLLPRKQRRSRFREIVNDLEGIDLFIHDSEHTFAWQQFEYSTVFPHLRAGGLLLTDDAHESYAFFDFCRSHGLKGLILIDGDKAIGAALRTS